LNTVLVVDDEPAILRTMQLNLKSRGYRVVLATTGSAALSQAAQNHPDLVVLDLGLPGMDGLDVISGLRGWTEVPIIVLSARKDESQKVVALDLGANDYVTKPFGMDELMARIRVALRSSDPTEESAVVETADFSIDLAKRQVRTRGVEVRFTATEWRLLELLVRNPGRLLTHHYVLDRVWDVKDTKKLNYIRVCMVSIRRKLEPDPPHPKYFITEPGSGLRFYPEGDGDSPA
jgi:two-component system, OmpR family, KDP operon response regulator KdpE